MKLIFNSWKYCCVILIISIEEEGKGLTGKANLKCLNHDFWFFSNAMTKSWNSGITVQPADIYLIDEPSAYLDSEQRIVASKVIKRFILHAKKTAFVVEHDFIMATYLADKVIVYEGKPSIDCIANTPQSLVSGMNRFLSVSTAFYYALF